MTSRSEEFDYATSMRQRIALGSIRSSLARAERHRNHEEAEHEMTTRSTHSLSGSMVFSMRPWSDACAFLGVTLGTSNKRDIPAPKGGRRSTLVSFGAETVTKA